MPSPFPGIDPYIEAQNGWPDFHARFLTYCCDLLADRLPASYVARMDELVHLVRTSPDSSRPTRPDVAILKESGATSRTQETSSSGGIATLEPVSIALETTDPEEVRETWIEIRRLPELSLVAVIELLSPSNKVGVGRFEYLDKRLGLIDRPVHLIELDFLLAGLRLPMARPLPAADAYALVARAERRPDADVYSWNLSDRLPTIPIPLEAPDPDVPLDLAQAYAQAYDRGRYARILRYEEPLPASFAADARAWAEERARKAIRS